MVAFGTFDLNVMNGNFDIEVDNELSLKSRKGNIILKTEGDFDLLENDGITEKGFQNLGKRGNIQIISTFGNINLQCVEDSSKANFHNRTTIVPWNPGFLAEIAAQANNPLFENFNKNSALWQGEKFLKDFSIKDLTSNFSLDKFLDLFNKIKNELFIYDGLPVFLPTKMIIQNPNIQAPLNTDDISWIPTFRSELNDWRENDSNVNWKLPGRCMGNINIETWSGDINIKTDSSLGCAGNILISAKESGGTFPGYKIGTIDIKNEANKRIYPDPRDLFFDSDFKKRLNGQFQLFSHGTSEGDKILSSEMRTSLLPTEANNQLKAIIPGISFDWKSLGYDKFYENDSNCIKIISKGQKSLKDNEKEIISLSEQNTIESLRKLTPPKLGCPKCISDFFIGLPGIQDLCYSSEKYDKIALSGFHKYCFSRFNPFKKTNARGTFNLTSFNYNELSLGDGHAIEIGFCDKELTGPNMGAINISCAGDFNKYINRNEHKVVNQEYPEGKLVVNNTYSEYFYDDKWPELLCDATRVIGELWNSTIGLINLREGNIDLSLFGQDIISTVLNIKGLDSNFPINKFYDFGYQAVSEQILGSKIINKNITNRFNSFDFGISGENAYEWLKKPSDTSMLKYQVINDNYDQHIVNFDEAISSKVGDYREFLFKCVDPWPITINIDHYGNKSEQLETFTLNKNSNKKLDLYWDKKHIENHISMPNLKFSDYSYLSNEVGNKGINTKEIFDITLMGKDLIEHLNIKDNNYIINSTSFNDFQSYQWNRINKSCNILFRYSR